MPRLSRRTGTIGLALTAWDIWRRIPPEHRKLLIQQARRHGPRIATRIVNSRRKP
ncbi:MAG TPA: hypothetical protein VI142_08015 [Gaiellaceae bacterium]